MITSYATLKDAIIDRMNDASLEDYVPEFVQMAEARFNRLLATLDAEGVATNAAEAVVALPTDFKALRSVHLVDYGPLSQLSPDEFQRKWERDTAAQPENYALIAGSLYLGPQPDDDYQITLTYVRTLTGLSDENTTNWLLESHPDLYLYSALIHAEFRGWNDERLPILKAAADEMVAEINTHDRRKRRGDYQATVSGNYF